MEKFTGIVKFFNTQKGFGFITPDSGDKEIFVHVNGVEGGSELNEGQKVEYTKEQGKKGPEARNVRGL